MTIEERCVEWMRDVIEVHMDMEYGKRPTEGEHLEAIEDAEYVIDCIEKQIPKKPIWRWDGNETVIECPNCGKYPFDLSEYEWARIFCGHCGQAIDWSEVE